MSEDSMLIGPLRLNPESVGFVVTGELPGVFALGRMRSGSFEPALVGRSDDDIRSALLTHAARAKYKNYAFRYDAFAHSAFESECAAYHRFRAVRRLDNKRHPEAKEG